VLSINSELLEENLVRVLVCGGRDFNNVAFIWSRLDALHEQKGFTHLIHGGARGADTIAGDWAKTKPIERYVCRADWDKYGKAAGPYRNARMLEWLPDLVVAFPGGRGTADMIRQAKSAGVEVVEIK
jgi:hypothetical protein